MGASDFTAALYLNQAAVFDLLAIIEDGMAQMLAMWTSETSKGKAETGIGASNVAFGEG